MKLKDLVEMKPADDHAGTWDRDMDMSTGLGRLWHNMKVEASYSHQGSYDRWIPLKTLMTPQWQLEKHYGGEDGFRNLIDELQRRGKIEVDERQGAFRIAPEVAASETKARDRMAKTVADWEKGGRSFTYGT